MQQEQNISAPLAPPPLFNPRKHALFLDFDGTLVDIQERPHAVHASESLLELLHRLNRRLGGAVALVTGRTVADIEQLLRGAFTFVAGVHGAEMQRGANVVYDESSAGRLSGAREAIRDALQRHALPALTEDKGESIALHYRHAPEAGEAVKAMAHDIAKAHGVRVLEGKMVVELIATHRTKGHALTVFMAQPPFAGRIPIAVGDDRTDEDAFAAATRLSGYGVRIGDAPGSLARYGLAGPAAVHAWLESGLRQ